MHAIVFGGLGHLEEKVFNALVIDYIEGWPTDSFTFVTADKGTASMLAEKLASTLGISCVSVDGLVNGMTEVLATYTRPSVMVAVHDEDPEMLNVMDMCREVNLEPLDLCIGLIPLFDLMNIK